MDENDIVLVAFVLPFLPVSQRFKKEFEGVGLASKITDARNIDEGSYQAAQQLRGSGVQFAKVDCTKETKVYEMFKYSRWPTVRLFRGLHNIKDYEGAWQKSE